MEMEQISWDSNAITDRHYIRADAAAASQAAAAHRQAAAAEMNAATNRINAIVGAYRTVSDIALNTQKIEESKSKAALNTVEAQMAVDKYYHQLYVDQQTIQFKERETKVSEANARVKAQELRENVYQYNRSQDLKETQFNWEKKMDIWNNVNNTVRTLVGNKGIGKLISNAINTKATGWKFVGE